MENKDIETLLAVSYTHLDVYKRQIWIYGIESESWLSV